MRAGLSERSVQRCKERLVVSKVVVRRQKCDDGIWIELPQPQQTERDGGCGAVVPGLHEPVAVGQPGDLIAIVRLVGSCQQEQSLSSAYDASCPRASLVEQRTAAVK